MNVLCPLEDISVPFDALILLGAFNVLVPLMGTGWHPMHATAKVGSISAGTPHWTVEF